jgi:hypothetical protein
MLQLIPGIPGIPHSFLVYNDLYRGSFRFLKQSNSNT